MAAVQRFGAGLVLAGLLVTGVASLSAPSASAAEGADTSDLRIVSSFAAPGEPVPSQCRQEASVFAGLVARYPRPASWHWVLVCDEAGWRRFLRLSGRAEGDPIYASTDLSMRRTYVRGAALLPWSGFRAPDEVIAHELAHIYLHSPQEGETDSLAAVWRQRFPGRPAECLREAECTQN